MITSPGLRKSVSSNIKLRTSASRVYTLLVEYTGDSGLAGRVLKPNMKYCCVTVRFGGFGENIELLDRCPPRFWSSRANIKWRREFILHRELVTPLPDLGRKLQPRTQAACDYNIKTARCRAPGVPRSPTSCTFDIVVTCRLSTRL